MKPESAIHIIDWEKCASIDEALGKTAQGDRGLYQIYGAHEIYSKDGRGGLRPVLLYVGRTTGQTFGERLRQHNQSWIQRERERCPSVEFSIHVGRLRGDHTDECVSDAEKVTIWWSSPAYNSANVARAPSLDSADRVEIRHEGERADLPASHSWPTTSVTSRGDEA